MLVLSRKAHEAVWIGENVQITVLSVQRGRVKLGIEAPSDVLVQRAELREALQPNEA